MASRVLRTGGLFFDGVDDYVSVPHSSSLEFTSVTLMVWFNPINVERDHKIVSNRPGQEIGVVNSRNYGEFLLQFTDGTELTLYGDTPFANVPNRWYHLAGTWDGTWARLYGNGSLIKETSAYAGKTLRNPTIPLTVGRYSADGYFFQGFIDEVRVYNRALSADEISEIYSKGVLIKDGLVLCLPFHEGEGNIVHDVSGYNNHGTIYGDPVWAVKKALAR